MGRKRDLALRETWRMRWKRFSGASVTVAEFCRREGVSQAAFYQWRKRLAEEASAGKTTGDDPTSVSGEPAGARSGRAAFVELTWGSSAVVELDLPNGVRVRVPADQEAALGAAIRAAGELEAPRGDSDTEAGPC